MRTPWRGVLSPLRVGGPSNCHRMLPVMLERTQGSPKGWSLRSLFTIQVAVRRATWSWLSLVHCRAACAGSRFTAHSTDVSSP